MKNASTAVLCLSLVLSAFVSNGQNQKIPLNEPDYNRPKIFQNLPDSIPVDANTLSGLFNAAKGESVAPTFANRSSAATFLLRGEIISKTDNTTNNLQSRNVNQVSNTSTLILKLSDYNSTNFTLSKITSPDGTIKYTGRIINFRSGDLFVLQNVNGNLVLVKKDYYTLVNE